MSQFEPPPVVMERMFQMYGKECHALIRYSAFGYVLERAKLHLALIIVSDYHVFCLQARHWNNPKMILVIEKDLVRAGKSLDLNCLAHGELLEICWSVSEAIHFKFLHEAEELKFEHFLSVDKTRELVFSFKPINTYFAEQFLLSSDRDQIYPLTMNGIESQAANFAIDEEEFDGLIAKFLIGGVTKEHPYEDLRSYETLRDSAHRRASMKIENWNITLQEQISEVMAKMHQLKGNNEISLSRCSDLKVEWPVKEEERQIEISNDMMAVLAKLRPEEVEDKLPEMMPLMENATLTELLSNLCHFYGAFKEKCETIAQKAIDLLPLAYDDLEACNFEFLVVNNQEMLNMLKIELGDVQPLNSENTIGELVVPVLEFVHDNIKYRFEVDARAHSWPTACRGLYEDTKHDIPYSNISHEKIEVAEFILEASNDTIYVPMCCVVTYNGYTIFCEAQDRRMRKPTMEINPKKKIGASKTENEVPEVLQNIQLANVLIYGSCNRDNKNVFVNHVNEEEEQFITSLADISNMGRHFVPLPGQEISEQHKNSFQMTDLFESSCFISWLKSRLGERKDCPLTEFFAKFDEDIVVQFPGLCLEDCKNEVFSSLLDVFDCELSLKSKVQEDGWGNLYLHDYEGLLTPDMPSYFLKTVGSKINASIALKKGVLAELQNELEVCRLPLQFTSMFGNKSNPDAWTERLSLDEPHVERITQNLEQHINDVENGFVKLDRQILNHYLLFMFIIYQSETGIRQTVNESDIYRAEYLPRLQSLLDDSIENGELEIVKLDELYEYFAVPEYLRTYTACCSRFSEAYELIWGLQVTKSLVLLLNRVIRQLTRRIHQHGYDESLETLICQELQLQGSFRFAPAEFDFELIKNSRKRMYIVEMLVKREILHLLNAFYGRTSQEALFNRIGKSFVKYFHQHSFSEYYLHLIGVQRRIFLPNSQNAVFETAQAKYWSFSCFERLTGCIMADKSYNFDADHPFALEDILDIVPLVQEPVHWVLGSVNVPYRSWREAAEMIEKELKNMLDERHISSLKNEIELRYFANSTETAPECLEISLKSLFYNMKYASLSINCVCPNLFVDLARMTEDIKYCLSAFLLTSPNEPDSAYLYASMSRLPDALWDRENKFKLSKNKYELLDAANQLLLRFFTPKSIAYYKFTLRQCMHFEVSVSKVDDTLLLSANNVLGSGELAGELLNYEGVIEFRNGHFSEANMLFERAVEVQRELIVDFNAELEKIEDALNRLSMLEEEQQDNAAIKPYSRTIELHETVLGSENSVLHADSAESVKKQECKELLDPLSAVENVDTLIGQAAQVSLILKYAENEERIQEYEKQALKYLGSEEIGLAFETASEVLHVRMQIVMSKQNARKYLLSCFLTNLEETRLHLQQQLVGTVAEAIECLSFLGNKTALHCKLYYLLGQEEYTGGKYESAACSLNTALQSVNSETYAYSLPQPDENSVFRLFIKSCVSAEMLQFRSVISAAMEADTQIPDQVVERLKCRIYTSTDRISEVNSVIAKCRSTSEKLDWWECVALVRMYI